MKKPDFFIVGAPRCATTAMCRYLGAHPSIFVPKCKEPCYFGTDMVRINIERITLEVYFALFEEGNDRICGEGSTWYILSERAAREIYEFNPRGKIIIHVRNPVDLLQSAHSHGICAGYEDIDDLELALAEEPARRAGKSIPRSCRMLNTLFYSDLVDFSKQIQRYFDVFGRGQVRVIIYDDIRKNFAKVYYETLEYLGVDPNFRPDFRPINANRRIRSSRLHGILKAPPPWLEALKQAVSPRIVSGIENRLARMNTKITPPRPLDTEFKRRLKQQFAPEVERQSTLLGRDLTHWSGQ